MLSSQIRGISKYIFHPQSANVTEICLLLLQWYWAVDRQPRYCLCQISVLGKPNIISYAIVTSALVYTLRSNNHILLINSNIKYECFNFQLISLQMTLMMKMQTTGYFLVVSQVIKVRQCCAFINAITLKLTSVPDISSKSVFRSVTLGKCLVRHISVFNASLYWNETCIVT